MPRTLLELCQQFANETGLAEPSQIIGSVDDQSKQFLALANREGQDFSIMANSAGGWQNLHKEYTFPTESGTPDYALPSDFAFFVNKTFWDGAYKWELLGPISAQEKQVLKYGIVANGPRRKFYVRNNRLYLQPTPASTGDTIAYDYYSNFWCQSNASAEQAKWISDTDTYRLDEECFIMGLKWRFLRAKGLDYSQEKTDYEVYCMQTLAKDGGARDLSLSHGDFNVRLLNEDNVPETGYGV